MAVPREVEQANDNKILSQRCGPLGTIDAKEEFSAAPAPIADQFEDWCDRQTFTPDQAEHAHHAIAYLRMAEDQPLPAPLRLNLARHIAAIHEGRL